MTALAGVIGWPVAHSRSPRLHAHWLARYGVNGAYLPLAVAPAQLPAALSGLRTAGFRGGNVTVPHKEAVLALCSGLDEAAKACGAVNTLVFGADGVSGLNTDGAGFLANLAAHGVAVGAPALLIGAGGAARAIAAALRRAGVAVSVTNRSEARVQGLAEARVVRWAQRDDAVADHGLIVNTTTLGMAPGDALPVGLERAPAGAVVADIVYVPRRTAWLQAAEAQGLRIVPGLGMLLHQAAAGFEAWFGVRPAVDAALEAAVGGDIPASW